MSTSLFEQYKAALRRGHVAVLAGDLGEALAAYDAAARLVPERALPLASRGTVLHRLDRWPEAAEAFDRALSLAPDDEAALRARATARAERGLRSGAAADFERLAFVLDVAGRAVDAADAARRAADLEPSASREALADRLGAAAAHMADMLWGRGGQAGPPAADADAAAVWDAAPGDALPDAPIPGPEGFAAPTEPVPDDGIDERAAPTQEATDAGPSELEAAWAAMAERVTAEPPEPPVPPEPGEPGEPTTDEPELEAERNAAAQAGPEAHVDLGAYGALGAIRAGLEAEERQAAEAASEPAATDVAEAEEPAGATPTDVVAAPEHRNGIEASEGDGAAWPGIDLPSPPPPPMEGPPPDPEDLLAEAALVLESGEVEAARDLMLTAVRVHREAGRTDAALDISLNLLAIAPGDPRVHLAIANLQLDRGWNAVAKEKLDLLVRLTSLTGDTQGEADVHGLASERLRDDPAASSARR